MNSLAAGLAVNGNGSISLDDQSLSSSVSSAFREAELVTCNTLARMADSVDAGLSSLQSAVNVVVPATARLFGAFFLPEAISRPLSKVVGVSTGVASSLIRGSFSAALQTITCGAPAWSQMARHSMAVSSVVDSYRHEGDSASFLARGIAQCAASESRRKTLTSYIETYRVMEGAETTSEVHKACVAKLSAIEATLGVCNSLSQVRAVLHDREGFVRENPEIVMEIAESVAQNIIEGVGSFYQQKYGRVLGGSELAIPETQRMILQERVAAELRSVFDSEYSSADVSAKLTRIAGHLNSQFGTYQSAVRGLLGACGGAVLYTEAGAAVAASFADRVFGALHSAGGWAVGLLDSACESVTGSITDIVSDVHQRFANYVGGVVRQAYDSGVESVTGAVDTVVSHLTDPEIRNNSYSPFQAEQVVTDPSTGGKVHDCRFGCHNPSSAQVSGEGLPLADVASLRPLDEHVLQDALNGQVQATPATALEQIQSFLDNSD